MPKQRHAKPARPASKKPVPKIKAKKTRPAAKAVRHAKVAAPAKAAARKAKARPAARPPVKATAKAPARRPAAPAKKVAKRSAAAAPVAKVPGVPAGPSSHELAVEAFEHGFQALQQRQFGRAAEFLAEVVDEYPDEKEMQERARVYLNICERQKNSHGPHPRSLEERISAATVAINRGAFSEALALLRKAESDHRDNDHVQYMLCVAHTMLGDVSHALEHLKLAVSLNHENRYLASQDADLDPLRADTGFGAALEAGPAARPAKTVARKR
jgi:tetratricopeptide (TPR) repeat protein